MEIVPQDARDRWLYSRRTPSKELGKCLNDDATLEGGEDGPTAQCINLSSRARSLFLLPDHCGCGHLQFLIRLPPQTKDPDGFQEGEQLL